MGVEQTWEEYAGRTTVRHGTWLGVILSGFTVLYWPLDFVIFSEQPQVIDAFVLWRLFVIAEGFGAALVFRYLWREDGRGSSVAMALMMIATSIVLGVSFARTGDMATVFFHGGYLVPLFPMSLPMLRLRERIAATGAVAAAYPAAFFTTAPSFLADPYLAHEASLLIFSAVLGVIFGYAGERLIRQNYEQQVALDDKARELEELDRTKNDFFANVSHELRTPLTLILGTYRELGREVAPELREHVALGERNAARLLVLIDELLELARFTSGAVVPRMRSVDVAALVREVAANFRPSSPIDGALDVTGAEAPLLIEADRSQLRTALQNLLSNAFKYTDPADRRVSVELSSSDGLVVIEVVDNGIGIAASRRSLVFDRFYQVDSSAHRRRGGIGIGLALVRDVARAHGGDVEVGPADGGGSRFTLRIAVGDGERAAPGSDADEAAEVHRLAARPPVRLSSAQASEPTLRVLVAEDDPELRAYIARLLSPRLEVAQAHDGEAALEAIRTRAPDLLVCDVMMPGLDGFALAERLEAEGLRERLPILFLTARIGHVARRDAYDAGADDFLTKPFDADELTARVHNLLRIRESERELSTMNEALETQVAQRTRQLRELTQHIESSQEAERRRIARDLHDETGQLLTALRMDLDRVRGLSDLSQAAEVFERMDEVLENAFAATRAIVGELRPRILDDLGLGAAAQWYVQRFEARSELEVSVAIEPDDLVTDGERSTAVFRILQEALTNVTRHSGAARVEVRLGAQPDGALCLVVEDDGCGPDESGASGFGLLGMKERARAFGGELQLAPGPAGGARLEVRLPSREAA